MKQKEIEILAKRYLNALTSKEEEQMLEEYLLSHDDLSHELRSLRVMFEGFATLREQTPQRSLHPSHTHRRFNKFSIGAWAAAAVIAAVGIYAAVELLATPYCYLNGVAVRNADLAMSETIYFDGLENFDRTTEVLDMIVFNEKEK